MGPKAENGVARGADATSTRPGSSGTEGFDRNLLRALENTSISVLYQDRDFRYLWWKNVPSVWKNVPLPGTTDADLFPEQEAERLNEAKQLVVETGEQARIEIKLRAEDGFRWFEMWIDPDRDEAGTIAGIVTTAVEITEQKRREQTLRALLREVSHRSKNLLAIIQSIATQTGRYSGTVGDFLVRFRGRLQSLAASQDLVTSSNWRGADLHELIAGQVVRFCADPVRNVRLEGTNPYLNPNAALHVGLALHELAVNSVSYGALSRGDGAVTISATTADRDDRSVLELVWREQSHARPNLSGGRRFGSVALEKVVPASLNGTASLSTDDGGLTYRLTIPAENFELE